jgi:hypothetical protein
MAADPLDTLRLTLMQDVLPVGLAVVERARKGGPKEVLAAFGDDPSTSLDRLRQEGEPVASQVRQTLDRFQPGLGNPVVKVEVEVREGQTPAPANDREASWAAGPMPVPPQPGADDGTELHSTLAKISARLAELERRLV